MSQYGIESCMLHDSLKLKKYTVLDNFFVINSCRIYRESG